MWASVVRRYVPWVPEAQAIFCETALTPRRLSVVRERRGWGAGWARGVAVARISATIRIGRLSQNFGGSQGENQNLYHRGHRVNLSRRRFVTFKNIFGGALFGGCGEGRIAARHASRPG